MPPAPLSASAASALPALGELGVPTSGGGLREAGASAGSDNVPFPQVLKDHIKEINKASQADVNKGSSTLGVVAVPAPETALTAMASEADQPLQETLSGPVPAGIPLVMRLSLQGMGAGEASADAGSDGKALPRTRQSPPPDDAGSESAQLAMLVGATQTPVPWTTVPPQVLTDVDAAAPAPVPALASASPSLEGAFDQAGITPQSGSVVPPPVAPEHQAPVSTPGFVPAPAVAASAPPVPSRAVSSGMSGNALAESAGGQLHSRPLHHEGGPLLSYAQADPAAGPVASVLSPPSAEPVPAFRADPAPGVATAGGAAPDVMARPIERGAAASSSSLPGPQTAQLAGAGPGSAVTPEADRADRSIVSTPRPGVAPSLPQATAISAAVTPPSAPAGEVPASPASVGGQDLFRYSAVATTPSDGVPPQVYAVRASGAESALAVPPGAPDNRSDGVIARTLGSAVPAEGPAPSPGGAFANAAATAGATVSSGPMVPIPGAAVLSLDAGESADAELPLSYAPGPLSSQPLRGAEGTPAGSQGVAVRPPESPQVPVAGLGRTSAQVSLPAGTFSEGGEAASNPFFTPPSALPAAPDLPASLRSTPRRTVDPAATAISATGAVTAAPAASISGAPVPVAVEGLAAATVGAVKESLTVDTAGVLQAAAGDPRPVVGESAFATSLASAVGRSQEAQVTPAALPQAPGSLPVLLGAATGRLGEELGQRILWLSGHNLRSAEIQIDPPELGPLQVQVHTHRDGASIQFTTHSAAVRDALESNLPRLRELLEGSGLNLLDVNVAQQQQRGAPGERDASAANAQASRGRLAGIGQAGEQPAPARRSLGLVDDYA